jgi:DNA polymerase-3 subunit epsilon
VTLDVEYVGSRSRRPLQLGLVEVVDGELARRHMRWVRTPGHPWHCVTTTSRGMSKRGAQLTRATYEAAPLLPDAWPELAELIAERPVVVHNAGGDIAAVRGAFDDLGLPWPRLTFVCSLQLARAVWPAGRGEQLRSHQLLDLAAHLFPGVGLFSGHRSASSGHDPVEDAEAVAWLMHAAQQVTESRTLTELLAATGRRAQTLEPDRCESSRGWINRVPTLPSPADGLSWRPEELRAAYLELRATWRGDAALIDAARWPNEGDPLLVPSHRRRRGGRW